ncbi:cation:proton antiporter [Solirubrobacter soli]|uniref:cation:proton antiporter n=1 Tax=Solirubrobacter soli TaxID=363832 RepID=UPI000415BBF2|nr:cation:proton antiporter [Solirubrobacter soli]
MSLGDLALIVAAGLAGPLLAASRRVFVPVVAGEILAGVILGRSGLNVIQADDATVSFLAQAGFAMLMLTVGMHIPLRDRRLRRALGRGALAAGVAAIAASVGALVAGELTGTGHAAVYGVVLASGSAAIVLPTLQERRLDGPEALVVIAQVTVADVTAILAVPLVLQPSRVVNIAFGGLLIAACALIVFYVARSLRPRPWVHRLRKRSKRRGWALDLRLALAVLFGLAWIAEESGASVLLGGFAMGLVVAGIGGPKRLSGQVRGVAEGFFVPLFFVVLGARLDVSALVDHPHLLIVTGVLIVLNLAVHAIAAVATRQPPAAALVATAQLGVPAAVVQIGLQEHVITPGLGAALTLAALTTLGFCALGTDLLSRRTKPSASAPRPALEAG